MGSSASKNTQEQGLELKLAVLSRRHETSLLLARMYVDPGTWTSNTLRDGRDFLNHETFVDGQRVQLQIYRLS